MIRRGERGAQAGDVARPYQHAGVVILTSAPTGVQIGRN
jgi:hypothetical protein